VIQPSPIDHLETILERDLTQIVQARQQEVRLRASGLGEAYVLFGAGRLGAIAAAGLRRAGVEPVAFADNNPALWNGEMDGLQVLPPQEAVARFASRAIFVVTVYTSQPVWDQLLALGVQPISFAQLGWSYPQTLLPHGDLEIPHAVFSQADDVRHAMAVWEDDTSRREFLGQLAWHTSLDRSVLPAHLPQDEVYFPDDLIQSSPDEVFVDCGAFDGDSIQAFVDRRVAAFRKIIAIEPDPANVIALRRRVASMPETTGCRISVLQNAVGSIRQSIQFNAVGTAASSVGDGLSEVQCAPLDELLADVIPTYLKMDIEGAELDALEGARRVITQHAPVLAICAYHALEHLWRIPLLIRSYNPEHRLFLRRYADECWELVCYAVPKSRMR